jgi:hypothetical protein
MHNLFVFSRSIIMESRESLEHQIKLGKPPWIDERTKQEKKWRKIFLTHSRSMLMYSHSSCLFDGEL